MEVHQGFLKVWNLHSEIAVPTKPSHEKLTVFVLSGSFQVLIRQLETVRVFKRKTQV